jgi:para-nitrobenzyl esterase
MRKLLVPRAQRFACCMCLTFIALFDYGCVKVGNNQRLLKATTSVRYRDPVFSSYDSMTLRDFRKAKSLFGKDTSLNVLFFEPSHDTATNRQVIIYLHGGGFISGSEYESSAKALCGDLALRGYVVASVGYRYGVNFNGNKTTSDSIQSELSTIYIGTQDARAAIRFLKANTEVARLDTGKITMVGSSAGAVLALNVAYLDQAEVPPAIVSKYGPLDGPLYYDYPFYSTKIGLIMNLEGAIIDTNLLTKGNTPVMSIYGEQDPFYKLTGFTMSAPPIKYYGGQSIHLRANHVQIPNLLFSFPGEHGFLLSPSNEPLTAQFIASNLYTHGPVIFPSR